MPGPAAARVLLAGALLTLAEPAAAQEGIFAGMQKGLESTVSSVSTTTTFASGLVVRSQTKNIFPLVRLTVDTLVYPNLRLNAGGVFELNLSSTRSGGDTTDSTITRNRPFFLLRSTNPVFSPGVGYFRREERARTAGLTNVKLVNDEYDAFVGWAPAGGPRSDFQFVSSHTFDGTKTFQDVRRGFATLVSNYTRGGLAAYYRGAYLTTDDRLQFFETRETSHSARVSDSGSLIRKRLTWNATYNVAYQDLRSAAGAKGGEVALAVTAFAGLAALSDIPVTARLTTNGSLIDGNLTTGAGVDIGLAPPPENAQARNIGLDLLNPTAINRLLIWVDRDLPFEVASSFSWEIYSSPDNVAWRRETVVSGAPFGPFENRFQVDFPTVTARYVKVVTRPLAVTVPDSSRFADVLVTELQAFLTSAAGENRRHLTFTTHLVNSDARMRLLDRPSLYYEGILLYQGTSGVGTRTSTLSNGFSVNHSFGRIFSTYARVAREQGREPRGPRVATVTNATFTVDPTSTFRSSLLYLGQDERIAGMPSDRRGLFVQNSAQVYRGVDVLFGVGWNSTTSETGEVAHGRLINGSATVVPRQRFTLTFSYDDTVTRRTGEFVATPETHTRRMYAAVAFDPLQTLHLVLGEDVLQATGERTRTTFDVGANWAPFPDGALQLVFTHNESLRALEFGKDRSTLGVVRWNLSRRSYLDVSYQRTRSEFIFQTTESRIFSVSLRLLA